MDENRRTPKPRPTRSKRWRLCLLGVGFLAVAATGAWLWRSGSLGVITGGRETSNSASASATLPALPGLPGPAALSQQAAQTTAAVAPMQPISDRVPSLIKNWRTAILNKDAETVELLDRSFAAYSREFIPALMESARSDPEDRVRSFSARVLGKLRPPESSELMRTLLSDPSEYVRFNAAWALGELGDLEATSRLRHMEKRDPSPHVRRSAGDSLRKMNGG